MCYANKNLFIFLSLPLHLRHTVRRSSTKKSDYFTKRYSQPQLETTGHEFTCTTNHPHHQRSTPPSASSSSSAATSLTVSPTTTTTTTPSHVRSDAQFGGLETVAGNTHRPYLNRRTQLYRYSCDDYHSGHSDTLASDDTCRFGSGATASAAATITNKMQSDTASPSPPPPPSRPSSASSSSTTSSSTAQNRCHTEHGGTEPVPTNAIDLATDNLPAVDCPDACDKAALR